ncbi:MAG: hypothetical protein PHF57_12485 [Methanoregula sp.]|nr:hypothetical protein [Methanoregula sp.]
MLVSCVKKRCPYCQPTYSWARVHRVIAAVKAQKIKTAGQVQGLLAELERMSTCQRARVRDECRELLEAMLHD